MKHRIVVKIGSNVLARADGTLDVTRMSSFVDQITILRQLHYEVILVSSGAVACGRSELKTNRKLDSVEQRQLFSAVGQVKLMNLYYDLFRERKLAIGQVLTMKENFATRREYLNQRNCMEVMLQTGVIPIVNENDTVSVTELMFTDNDELSGLIASMMGADSLIILSNVDGLFNGSPSSPNAHVIARIEPDANLDEYIQTEKSGLGRGGMSTKCRIARRVAAEGIRVCLANGCSPNILVELLTHPDKTIHTEFVPSTENVSSVKKWIAHSAGFAKGVIHLNHEATRAIAHPRSAVSVLFVGITAIDGDFEEGDIVSIVGDDGQEIAVGRSGYGSQEARTLIGCRNQKPIVHYDYLFLNE